jgi:hypothetical protein
MENMDTNTEKVISTITTSQVRNHQAKKVKEILHQFLQLFPLSPLLPLLLLIPLPHQ